jgi:hypothetical protein
LDDIGTNVDYLFDLRTEKGELNTKAKAVKWEGGELSLEDLKKFIEENDYSEKYENSKYFDGKYDKDSIFDFIQSKKEYREKYNESFGETMSRDELVEYIEENGLEEELRQRVVDKWEAFEDSIKSNRKKKYYSKQPESEE